VPLTRDSVVVAAGGGRGIGAEILKALALQMAPRIIVLGSTPLPDQADADLIAELIAEGRAAFIRNSLGRLPSVAAANAAFERLLRAQELRATMAALAASCGGNRVTYHLCDLRDATAVQRVVGHIQRITPRVDLLLNVAAGIPAGTL